MPDELEPVRLTPQERAQTLVRTLADELRKIFYEEPASADTVRQIRDYVVSFVRRTEFHPDPESAVRVEAIKVPGKARISRARVHPTQDESRIEIKLAQRYPAPSFVSIGLSVQPEGSDDERSR